VKSALTGNGRASKEQIQRMVRHTFGLIETPRPPDVADAVAIALCHLYHEGRVAS
jgi:crossover junction endodeoxyribonuclease RuvC